MPKKKFLHLHPRNIIIRMPNWLGDAVMATPLLTDIKKHWKAAKLTAILPQHLTPLLQHDVDVDEVIGFQRENHWLRRWENPNMIRLLQKGQYDLGILLTNSFSSGWWFYRGNVKNTIGFVGNLRSFLLDYPIKRPCYESMQHLVYTYKYLLQPLGIPLSQTKPRIQITEEEKEEMKKWLQRWGVSSSAQLIGINPGAAYGSAKCWPPERFKSVIKKLSSHPDISILVFGDEGTAEIAKQICHGCSANVIDLSTKTTLRQLITLISLCDLLLTNDSGPMHIASAVQTPLVAIFGSTSEVKTGPYEGGTIIHKHVECSPCYLRTCPIDFRCMKQIEVNEVLSAIQNILDNRA